MNRTERFYRIELLIKSRGGVSFEDLQAEMNVSRATLKRDLQFLRDRMDAPIVYDRFDNVYRFEGGSATAPKGTQHELPGVWFSQAEIHALLTMHQLIAGLDAGGVLGRHLQLLLDMLYFTRGKQAESQRIVSPQRLIHYRNTWYLDAWCHSSEGLRRFALDAVRGAKVLDLKAKDVAMKTVQAELDGGYGIFSGKALQHATLRFMPEAAQWVAHEEWHPQQQLTPLPDGALEMRLPYADATELSMDILRHGAQVQVLAPTALVRRVADGLRAAAAQYG